MNDTRKLEERVAALERTNRRLVRATALALVLLASTVWMGQRATTKKKAEPPAPRVVEAERFIVKKPDGQIVATFGVTDNVPMLRMNGPDFTERLNVSLARDGTPRITFLASEGHALATLAVGADGATSLELTSGAGAARLSAGVDGVRLGLADVAGNLRASFGTSAETTALMLHQPDGTARAELSLVERGPGLTLNDAAGGSRVMLTVRPEQSGLGIADAKGDVRAGLAVQGNNPAFALYDERGRVLFSKPS